MNPQPTDRLHFDLQLAYARPVIALLAILCLLELRTARQAERPLSFLIAYLFLAVIILLIERALRRANWHLPLVCDILVVGVFLYLSHEVLPAWFLLFFVAFSAGYRWNLRSSLLLSFGLLLLAVALDVARTLQTDRDSLIFHSLPFFATTLLAAGGVAFLGERNRRFATQQEFLGRLSQTMHVDLGLAESLRLLLEELCAAFAAAGALLAYRDADLERIFLWRLKSGESERLSPENLPVMRADGFLLDDLDASLCWNVLESRGTGFGWDRRNGRSLRS